MRVLVRKRKESPNDEVDLENKLAAIKAQGEESGANEGARGGVGGVLGSLYNKIRHNHSSRHVASSAATL